VGLGIKKGDLQRLARAKLEDGLLLFNSGRFSNAYYLAGYAVEFAFKACIAKQISGETIPEKKFILDIHTHDLSKLAGLAGLRNALQTEQDADREFHANWGIAAQWAPEVRYEPTDRSMAQLLLGAIADPQHGVLQWIEKHW
jgi:hypothetical protein